MRVFTAWGTDGTADLLIEGEGPPRFANNSLMDPRYERIWRIEANTINEAMSRYHVLQGWSPYIPIESLGEF